MNVTFPAFELTPSLHIRDLYVPQTARRSGVGRMLVKAGARLAVNEGFSALEWTTEATNTGARQMYEFAELNRPIEPITVYSTTLCEVLPPDV